MSALTEADLAAYEARAAESPLCGYGCRAVASLVAEVRRLQTELLLQGDWEHLCAAEQSARIAAESAAADLERQLDHERTGRLQAEELVAELEALIAEHERQPEEDAVRWPGCCQRCKRKEGHRDDCPWGQAAANHRARVAGEGVANA